MSATVPAQAQAQATTGNHEHTGLLDADAMAVHGPTQPPQKCCRLDPAIVPVEQGMPYVG